MVNKVTWTEDSNAQTHKNFKFNNLLVKAHNRSVSEANKSRRAKVEAKGENTRKTRGNVRLERFTQRCKDELNTESYTGTVYTKNYTGNNRWNSSGRGRQSNRWEDT